jgi:hypothetical protein
MKKKYTTSLLLFLFGLLSFNSFAQINAADDTIGIVYGATDVAIGNFLQNDTINGAAATISNVTITITSSTYPGIYVSGSSIIVPGGTPQGTYTVVYTICSLAIPYPCDTATLTINTEIVANPDNFTVQNCPFYQVNVSSNPTPDTLNGIPVIIEPYYTQPGNVLHPANVTLTLVSGYPGINLNTANGNIFVNPGALLGNYLITYQICEIAHPNNCSVGYVNIQVIPGFINAQNDDFSSTPINNTIGGSTPSVLTNDYSNCYGTPFVSQFSVQPLSVPSGLVLNPDGTITVAIGTSPGTYLVNYQFCDNSLPGYCSNPATASVVVTGISALVANYDDFSALNYPNTTTASVLANDTLNGSPINPSDITITGLNNPAGFTLNANGTITISASVQEGTYTVPYRICNNASPTDCYVNYAYVVVFKNRILGKIKFDANSNGCDASDPYLNYIGVKNVNGSNTYSNYTNYNGASQYYLIGDVGTNTVSVTNLPSYFTVTPTNQVFNFTTPGTTTATDFCVSINSNVDDLEVVLIPKFNVVPGLPALFDVWFKNNGSTTLTGQITFQFDTSKMSFLTSSPSPNSFGTNTLIYNFSTLAPFESRIISNVKFQVATPPTVNSGNVVTFSGAITPVISDATTINNFCAVNQTVVNSQDPNDIVVHEGAAITLSQAQQGYLHYTIRFQNVGTSNAINIKVLNDLDPKLDWSTFQLISTSHNCRIKNKNAHNEFLFENINLPGTANEPLSHGYITYKVKPISTIAVGNVIPNIANIYFDFNAPIVTNTASTTVVSNLANTNFAFNDFRLFPNPVKNTLTISNASTINEVEITSVLGQSMLTKKVNDLQTEINLSELSSGIYFVKVKAEGEEKTVRIVKE